jgi:paraquat-inducible protein B
MSDKANPTLIGAFVVGAAALVVAGVVILGGGRWLTPGNKFVMYFKGSVAGLQIGAPVDFRGVRIGSVDDIRVELDTRDSTVRTPVFVEIEPRRIAETGAAGELVGLRAPAEETMRHWVERGLRGRLRTVSMVTGQVVVEFDFYPDTPIELTGIDQPFPELPTIPSPMEELTNTLVGLPIEELVASLLTTVQTLQGFLARPELEETPQLVNETLVELRQLLVDLDRRVAPLTESLARIPERTDAALADVGRLLRSTDERIASLVADLERTSKVARGTLERADETLSGIEGAGSELRYELTVTLREVAAAARSLRVLAETLEQRPEVLLRGKRKEGG